MDDGSGLSLCIAQVVQRLRGSHLHSQIERQAKECLHQPEIKLDSLKDDVRSFLKTSGWERQLQNAVYRELHVQLPPSHPAAPPEHLKEPLAYMRKAQASWEKRVLKSLNSMSTELGVPLARMRPAAEQKELANKWNEMGADEPDLTSFRPVYAPKDFLEVLIGLRNPNHDGSEDVSVRSHWGLVQVPLNVRDIPQLRQAYSELSLTTGQLGIDDHAHIHPDMFENEYVQIGKKVLAEQDSAAAQQYSRQGCSTGLRADLWALILNSNNQPQDVMHYEQLTAGVIQHDLLVDNLIYKDVKLTASNDDYYFVFEDFLYQLRIPGRRGYNRLSQPLRQSAPCLPSLLIDEHQHTLGNRFIQQLLACHAARRPTNEHAGAARTKRCYRCQYWPMANSPGSERIHSARGERRFRRVRPEQSTSIH